MKKLSAEALDRIRKYPVSQDWFNISWDIELSEDIIRDFYNKVNWCFICSFQKLSENFIREFQHNVFWTYLSMKQELSEDFIIEFKAINHLSNDAIIQTKNYMKHYSISQGLVINFNQKNTAIDIKYINGDSIYTLNQDNTFTQTA